MPEVSAQPDPARRPVLVVEDNRETLFIYEKFLKGSPFQVIPARTVREARRLLEQIRPAAVVLDVMLEGESTWELLGELKQREAKSFQIGGGKRRLGRVGLLQLLSASGPGSRSEPTVPRATFQVAGGIVVPD